MGFRSLLLTLLAAWGLALVAPAARAAPCDAPPVEVRGHGRAEPLAAELASAAPALWGEVHRLLALTSCAPVRVDLLPAIEGAAALDPPWHLPGWAAGAARPGERHVVIAVTAAGLRQDRERVLAHELAHVGVQEAAGGRPVPRWLDEGTARVSAREHSTADLDLLARARVTDAFIPLEALVEMFPADGGRAALAYAESGRAVSLLEGQRPGTVASVLQGIAAGQTPDDALEAVTGRRTWQLDRDVQRSIPRWRAWAVLGRDMDLLFVLAAVVTAFAGVRARRRLHERLAQMPLEPPEPLPHLDVALVRWSVAPGR